MSRIHSNRNTNWAPDPPGQGHPPPVHNVTLQRPNNVNAQCHSDIVGNSQWDLQRLMELDGNKNWRQAYNPRMSMSFTNTKGLLNAPGANNCFLNSAVQVLWHLDVFRRSFRLLSGHQCLGSNSCIFCALKVIFTQFQYSDQSALPPDSLRTALAKTFADQQRFQLGLMDDAAECFENILTQIHFHIANGESEDMCNAKHCISHQVFAMTILEQVVCQCEATSEPLPFNQMVHYVSTSALVSQVKSRITQNSAATFGGLLRRALSDGDYRNCPSACGRRVQLRRTLMNAPSVTSVGLVWDSENPSPDHIHDVVRSIGTTLRLTELFHSVVDPKCRQGAPLQLVGIVCYYGKHYSTFFFHSKMKMWVSFDDATIREVGSQWSSVVDKCCRGHYQPLLLLYANPDADVICTETAPQKTTVVKETKFLNNNEESGLTNNGSYHCRQRSCDSLSGTVGGQCMDDVKDADMMYTKGRRSMTPNPDSRPAEVQYIPRRSITPGPEWVAPGDEDSQPKSPPEVRHKRQPSYLSAFNGVDGVNPNHGTAGTVHRPSAVHAKPTGNIGAYSVRYAQQGQKLTNSVDLLGSLPQQLSGQPNNSYGNQHGHSVHQNNVHQVAGHHGYQQQNHMTSYQSSSCYPAVSSSSQRPITSVAGSSGAYQVTNSHGGPSHQYSAPPYQGQHSAFTAQASSRPEAAPSQPLSTPNTPVIKRTRSLETSNESAAIHSSHQRPAVSRNRPSSARPYDYGNARPTVDPKTGAVSMPNRQDVSRPGMKQEWAEDVLIGDFTTPDSCEPVRPPKDVHSAPKEDEEDYGTYINRKTVQNVLNIQKNRNPQTSAPMGVVGGIKTAAMHGSNSSLEAADQKQQKAWLHNQALMRDLKVDIPGDNISLGSHKDSGYRSGGSSGDRNSASSNSSTSFDSPTADSFRGFPTAGLYRGLGHTYNCSSHSSSESLSSTQSGQTVKTIQNNRLSLIPENRPSSSSSSSTMTVNKSQESLVGSQGTIGSQDGLDGFTSDHNMDNPRCQEKPTSHTGSGSGITYLQGLDAECERLFLQAEALMESSNQQEEKSDVHSALAYCNQAISCLQKALSHHGASSDTVVRLRMKHNSCVLRSRHLHKMILDRQLSSQSTASNQSTGSAYSADESIGSRASDDGLRLHSKIEPPSESRTRRRSDHNVVSPEQHLSSGPHGNSGTQSQLVSRQVAVSGMAQSRPVAGITMGTCNVPRSATDLGLSQYTQDYTGAERSCASKNISRSRNSSFSNDLERDELDANDTRNVEIYGTLPKRKGKGSKSGPIAVAPPKVPNDSVQVYQSYLQRQQSATSSGSEGGTTQPPVVNHSRQLSKDEIRDILVKDYIKRPDSRGDPRQAQPPRTRRRNSYDLLDPEVRNASSGVHSRQNSYEDMLAQQTGLPPKQSHAAPSRPVVPAKEESHYDYLPGRQHKVASAPSSPVKVAPVGYPHSQGVAIPGRYMEPPQPAAHVHSQVVNSAVKLADQRPHVMDQVKNYEIMRPEKPAIETVPIKVKPELPPKISSKGSKPSKPSKPAKAAKPDVPKRIGSQLSTFKGDVVNASTAHISHPVPDTTSMLPNGVSEWQNNGHQQLEQDLPPPPDELLYPAPDMAPGPPVIPDPKAGSRCTCGASRQNSQSNPPPPYVAASPQTVPPLPGYPTTVGSGHPQSIVYPPTMDSDPPPPPPPAQSPPKPALAKKKLSPLKGRKSVTFSDNVALIATPEDVSQEIDYVAYVMNLGRKRGDANGGTDGDVDDSTTDSLDGNEVLKEGTVLCTLCRKKHIEPTEIYCQGCCFYMSQFQPQES